MEESKSPQRSTTPTPALAEAPVKEQEDELTDTAAAASLEPDALPEPSAAIVFSPTRKSIDPPAIHSSSTTQAMAPPAAVSAAAATRTRLVFESPRIHYPDAILFPAAAGAVITNGRRQSRNNPPPSYHQRHQYAQLSSHSNHQHSHSNQQQHHGPPRHVLSLGLRRRLTLDTVWAGMPRQAALKITELHLHFDDNEPQNWNAWWTALAEIFVNLKHLYVERACTTTTSHEPRVMEKKEAGRNDGFTDDKADPVRCTTQAASSVKQAAHAYLHCTQQERLAVLTSLPNLVSLNGKPFASDDNGGTQPTNPRANAFTPLVETVRASTTMYTDPMITCSLLDQDNGLADEEEFAEEDKETDDEDDDEDLDLEMEAIREILEATKSLGDDVFASDDQPRNKTRALTPTYSVDEKKEDEAMMIRTPPRNNPKQGQTELEYVSPETNVVACDWGVACGSLSIPTYFQNANATARFRTNGTRLRFRPRQSKLVSDVRSAAVFVGQEGAVDADRDRSTARMESAVARNADCLSIDTTNLQPLLARTDGTTLSVPRLSSLAPTEDSSASTPPCPLPQPARGTSVSPSFSSREINRTPAHASLTSPFPMQFRARAKQVIMAAKQKTHHSQSPVPTNCKPEAEVSDLELNAPAPVSDEALRKPIPLARTGSSPLVIDTAIPKDEANPRGEPTAQGTAPTLGRPPPCPRKANPMAVSSVKGKFKKRRGSKWREKVAARSSSIMDESDDDDEEDELSEEDDIFPGLENGQQASFNIGASVQHKP